jgi:cysteinyl-tRNA synthetase
MLRTHYRQPIDWTVRELERALADLNEWYALVATEASSNGTPDDVVVEALCDDLNTHEALVRMHELAKARDAAALRVSLNFLGFTCNPGSLARKVYGAARSISMSSGSYTATVIQSNADGTYSADPATQKWIDEQIERRKAARAAKNFAEADRIRDELGSNGFAIKDNKDGTTTWEPKR